MGVSSGVFPLSSRAQDGARLYTSNSAQLSKSSAVSHSPLPSQTAPTSTVFPFDDRHCFNELSDSIEFLGETPRHSDDVMGIKHKSLQVARGWISIGDKVGSSDG